MGVKRINTRINIEQSANKGNNNVFVKAVDTHYRTTTFYENRSDRNVVWFSTFGVSVRTCAIKLLHVEISFRFTIKTRKLLGV